MVLDDLTLERPGGEPLHGQIAAALRDRMARGELAPGQRLPPTRGLADRLGVNRGTVQKAYEELVAEGIARAHVGQGTFVEGLLRRAASGPVRAVSGRAPAFPLREPPFPSDLRRIEDPAWQSLARWAGRPEMISFAGGAPDARLFPIRPFKECLGAVLDEEGTTLLQYGASRGYPPFVEFLCGHLKRRGLSVGAENVLVVSGTQQGLDLIARVLIAPGDAVVVEDPTYSGALALFRLLGARLLPVRMDDDGMDVDQLADLLSRERPKLVYTIPTFHNPTGRTLSGERRFRLVEICRAAGVPLVEDDSDGELRFEGADLPRLSSLPGAEGVIYLGAFSKLFFPGLRLGWLVGEPSVVARLETTKRVADLHTAPLLQAAMARFASSKAGSRLARQVCRRYRARRDKMLSALQASMPEGVTWTRPQGGLSLIVDLGHGLDAADLLRRAVDDGVLFAPGHLFSPHGEGRSTLRLTFGSVEEEKIEEGVSRLGRAVNREMEGAGLEPAAHQVLAAPPPV